MCPIRRSSTGVVEIVVSWTNIFLLGDRDLVPSEDRVL